MRLIDITNKSRLHAQLWNCNFETVDQVWTQLNKYIFYNLVNRLVKNQINDITYGQVKIQVYDQVMNQVGKTNETN